MKYAVSCTMRIEEKQERDAIVDYLLQKLKQKFPGDDCFIETHKCYHDEDENKPCVPESHYKFINNKLKNVIAPDKII